MPWIEIGFYRFDLDEVVLVTKGVPCESGVPGVTIALACGRDVNLSREDAARFLELFDEFTASRTFGRGPPELGRVVLPRSVTRRPEVPRVEQGGVGLGQSAGDQEHAGV